MLAHPNYLVNINLEKTHKSNFRHGEEREKSDSSFTSYNFYVIIKLSLGL